MNSIGPPIYMIYTHTTHRTTTTNKTPGANRHCCPDWHLLKPKYSLRGKKNTKERKKTNQKQFSIISKLKKIQASLFKKQNKLQTWFAEEIWSQLDKPPWFKHFPFIWRPVLWNLLSSLWLWYVHWSHCQQPHWIQEARSACIFICRS